MRLAERIRGWWRGLGGTEAQKPSFGRASLTHVVILDGTMSSLAEGEETHAGMTYKLLSELPASAHVSLYYEAGVQWPDWRRTHEVAMGRGINRQIRRAYGYVASRYHPGDRIVLMGYSRGAYAVRSLAGVIDRVGLLRPVHATDRHVRLAYRHYRGETSAEACAVFSRAYCHERVEIEMLGLWDTVKALGLRLPFVWKVSAARHDFHNHELSALVRNGYHALALNETREVFRPVMWRTTGDYPGHVEQVWFRGAHGDVGGHLGGFEPARPLANISLVWMLERLEAHGVPLPEGWRARFPCDPYAPSVGTFRGLGKLFLARRRRVVGADPSESLHPTAVSARDDVALPLSDQHLAHGA